MWSKHRMATIEQSSLLRTLGVSLQRITVLSSEFSAEELQWSGSKYQSETLSTEPVDERLQLKPPIEADRLQSERREIFTSNEMTDSGNYSPTDNNCNLLSFPPSFSLSSRLSFSALCRFHFRWFIRPWFQLCYQCRHRVKEQLDSFHLRGESRKNRASHPLQMEWLNDEWRTRRRLECQLDSIWPGGMYPARILKRIPCHIMDATFSLLLISFPMIYSCFIWILREKC